MTINNETLTLPVGLDREGIRRYVIERFLDEQPGTGTGKLASKYIYEVEKCLNRRITIARPANLNKGMDFTVHVEGVKFRPKYAYKDKPKHNEIIDDLKAKKTKDPSSYNKVSELLKEIYLCQDITSEALRGININAGVLSCEEVCLTVKWLFIEQDITYWNWSGRTMFYNKLLENKLVEPLTHI